MKTATRIFSLCLVCLGFLAVTSLPLAFTAAAQDGISLYNAGKSGQTFSFAFRAGTGVGYQVEYRDGVSGGTWTKLESVAPSASRDVTIVDSAALSASRFYRLAADGPVYSCNLVGYINLTCRAGTNLIANQLFNAPNRLTQLIPTAPEDTLVWKAGWLGLECAEFYNGSWHDCVSGLEPDTTLYPGQGMVLITPAEFTVTFVGEVTLGALTNQLPAGLSLCSSIIPQAGSVSSLLTFPARSGDRIYQFDNAAQSYHTFTFGDAGWSPSEPELRVGEAFWAELGEATLWVRDFSDVGCGGGYYWVTNYAHQAMEPPAPGREPPVIVSNPGNQVAEPGSAAVFSVQASGSPRLRYHWRFGSDEIAGGTNATLRLGNVQSDNRGTYSVTVSNAFGCVTSTVARLLVEKPPGLQLSRAADGLLVCWADSATNYVLEQSEGLIAGWTAVSTAPTTQNGTQCVSAPVLGSVRFYRLRKVQGE